MAVGTHKGYVQIWDAAAGKKLSVLEGHTARVGKCGDWRDGSCSETPEPSLKYSVDSQTITGPPCLPVARCAGVECRPAVVWESRSGDPAARHPSATSPVGAPSPGTQAGGVWPQVEHRPPAARLGRK